MIIDVLCLSVFHGQFLFCIMSLRIPLSYFNVYSNKEHAMLIFMYVYFFILKAEKGILIYMV
ncbi:hypothetical protein KL86DYS2_11553 [uncultured Dysgonomonas sp.]|uniref:Uncharacterized protein n=1 Tax=uncultured Dysgonomonas sp. TaxID=206096 RepID=A0A212JHW2_9BACT|nr:hypothetical protein KL86DYS2_11553 [uncultured Dysgonomonas sp.]